MSKNYSLSCFHWRKLQLIVLVPPCSALSLPLSAQTIGCSAHLSRFNVLNIVICLNCFSIELSIDFILGKSWWFEKAKLIKHKLWSACRPAAGRLVVTLRKKKLISWTKKAPNVFLNELNKKKKIKYNHFAITYKKHESFWEKGGV